jgi:hypothetical protein
VLFGEEMKVHLVKKHVLPEDVGLAIYQPIHPSDVDYTNKFGDGEIIQAEIRRDRFYPLTKKYWALCNLIANNAKLGGYEFLENKDLVDEYIKIKLGVVKARMVYDNKVHIITGSIAHSAKDKDEFQDYYKRALKIMSDVSGISEYDLEDNWMEYETQVGEK